MRQPGIAGATLEHAGLLERADQLEALAACFADVSGGSRGRLVLVRGEAGIGKTALVRQFCADRSPPSLVLWGACEPLFTCLPSCESSACGTAARRLPRPRDLG